MVVVAEEVNARVGCASFRVQCRSRRTTPHRQGLLSKQTEFTDSRGEGTTWVPARLGRVHLESGEEQRGRVVVDT